MSLRFLLDTNIVSEPFRSKPNAGIMAGLQDQANVSAISVLTWHELCFGHALLPDSSRKAALGRFLTEVVRPTFPTLDYDRHAAEWHARERARLRKVGQEPPLVDAQIAATAAARNLVLVTHNRADFIGFDGLVVEDWTS